METAPLAEWLRWIAEMPAALRQDPLPEDAPPLPVGAVVSDVCEPLLGARPSEEFLHAFVATDAGPAERNRLRWVLAACHVLWHPLVRGRHVRLPALQRALLEEPGTIAQAASADELTTSEDRREELARRLLGALGMRLPGETDSDARARLAQVDSWERRELASELLARQRALRIAEELRRRAEAEAASKISRE
jgi:hypothetical protein